MQGIKFQLDPNSIARTKEEFNKFIQELENSSKINIKVNDKIFQELNTQISQTNGQLQNLVNKNNEVANSFASISSKTKGNKLFDVNSFVEYNNAIDKIKEKYSQLGQVNVTNKSFNPITKELESFSISVEKADGVIQKLKYDMQTVNGNKGFALNNFKEVDNTAKIREKQLQTEQKINRQIEQQNQRLNEQVTKSQDSINAIQMQWQQKINGLFAKDIIPKDKILQLENMIKNINLGTTKSDMQVIKGQYSGLVKLEQQLVAEKNKERDATKATMEAYVREQDRIAKMGTFKAKLPTQNIFKDNEALKSYIKSLYDAEAKITSFANSTKNAEQAQKTITVTTRNANNEVHRERIVIDEATQSIYKQSEAISSNSTRMVGFGTSIKNAMKHITSYMSTMMGFYAIIGQIRKGVEGLSEINRVQTNIRMVTGMNREQVQGLTKDFSSLAGELYTTNKEIMNGAESFMRAGKSIEATRNLLKASTIGSAISGQNNKETSEQLIAISNGFKMNAENAKEMMNIVDTLSTIDNNASTSFAELAEGMSRTSSSAQMAGTDMKTLASYIGTVSSTTRKSANTIGESFRSIFARYQDIRQGKKFDAENEALSNVETSLNKVGVAIRKDATHFRAFSDVVNDLKGKWKSLSDIQKTDISKSLAGTRQRENFLVLMDNLDQVDKLQHQIAGSAGSAEKKFKEAYGESTEAKVNKLKHSVEEFWMSVTSSSTINHLVGGLTHLVSVLNQITQAGWGTKLAIVGLGLTTFLTMKHFLGFSRLVKRVGSDLTVFQGIVNLLTGVETTCFTATEALKAGFIGLKGAIASLLTNPVTWIFVGLAVAIGSATYAIIKHMKKQKELKQKNEELSKSYKDLTTAMKNNDSAGMQAGADNLKKEQKKLQDLIKTQRDLQVQASKGVPKSTKGGYAPNTKYQLEQTNKAIKDQIGLLKQNGFHVNDVTGAIVELNDAEQKLTMNGMLEHSQELAQSEIDHKQEITALWKEYQTLSTIENKDEDQKQRLSSVTDDLKRYMGDLTVSVDENGVATIENTSLVGKEVSMLDTENITVQDLTAIKLEHARQAMRVQTEMTNCAYSEISQRIEYYQKEAQAMSLMKSINSTPMLDQVMRDSGQTPLNDMFGDRIKQFNTEINTLKDKKKQIDDQFSKFKKDLGGSKLSAPHHNSGGGGGYAPRGGSGRKSSGGSGSRKSETEYKYDGKQENIYDATIKTINNSLDKSDKLIEKITQKIANLQSLESKSNFKDILAQENEKLEAQKIKLERLKSAQSQADSMKEQIKEKFYSNWSTLKGKDLDTMSEKDWTNLYNSMYGKQINFGTDDSAKKKEEAYKKGAELFKELRKNYEDANSLAIDSADKQLKLEQEINSTIKERYEIQEKMYSSELEKHNRQLQDTENVLEIIRNNEEKNYRKQGKWMEGLFHQKRQYLNHVIRVRNEFIKQRNALEENSLAWNVLNQQVQDYSDKVIEANRSVMQQHQEIKDLAKEKVQQLIEKEHANKEKQLEQDVFKYTKEEWEKYQKDKVTRIKKDIEEINQFIKENGKSQYTDDALLARQTELDMIQSKSFNNLKDYQQEFEDIHNMRIKAIDDEIDALNKKNESEKESEEREKRRIDLEKIRQELENARNEKNIQQLTKDKNGLYQFVYVADQKKIDDLEEQLKKKQEENAKWEEDLEDKKKRKKLDYEKKFEEDLIKQKQDYHNVEKGKLDEHYSDMDKLTENYMNELKVTYNDKWDEIINVLEDKLSKAKELNEQLNEIGNGDSGNSVNKNSNAYKDFIDAKRTGNKSKEDSARKSYNKSSNSSHSPSKVSASDKSSFIKAKRSGDTKTQNSIRKKYSSFDTGGYTGAWGKEGKLAILHEKELVLDKYQTEDILKSVELLQKYNPLANIKPPNVQLPSVSELGITNKQPSTTQHIYKIDKLECPNVTNDDGVNYLFENLTRLGMQYNPEPSV